MSLYENSAIVDEFRMFEAASLHILSEKIVMIRHNFRDNHSIIPTNVNPLTRVWTYVLKLPER